MKLSARNQLKGIVRKITVGPVNAELLIELQGGEQITAVITKASAKALKLKRNTPAIAVIKASDVMVGVCCQNPDCDCGEK